jgi:hypothetical protein
VAGLFVVDFGAQKHNRSCPCCCGADRGTNDRGDREPSRCFLSCEAVCCCWCAGVFAGAATRRCFRASLECGWRQSAHRRVRAFTSACLEGARAQQAGRYSERQAADDLKENEEQQIYTYIVVHSL